MPSNYQLLVSISVPVYNRPKDIALCLESLFKLDFPREDYEIIVVDNGSTDNTKEVIQQFPVRYLFEPKRGRGAARNRGARESQGKYLAFIDSDCIATPNWLTELVKAMEDNPHMAALGGKIVPYRLKTWVERYTEARGYYNQEWGVEAFKTGRLPRFSTTNSIIKKAILDEIGNFDEEMESSVDAEFCVRLVLQGFQIGYCPGAIVCHRHRQTLVKYCLRRMEIGRGAYFLRNKYKDIFSYQDKRRNKAKFLALCIFGLLKIPWEFIFQIIKEKEYPERSFLSLEKMGKGCSVVAELFCCLQDIFFLFPSVSPPKNLDLDKVFHRNLLIQVNAELFKMAPQVVWFWVNNQLKFMRLKDMSCYNLNDTSSRIWQVLCETGDFAKTVQVISQEYQIHDAEVRRDIEDFLRKLKKEELLVIARQEPK